MAVHCRFTKILYIRAQSQLLKSVKLNIFTVASNFEMSTFRVLTLFGLLVFTFPSYCYAENYNNFGIFNINDPSADAIINPRIQPVISALNNNSPIDIILRNVIVEINRGVYQMTELINKQFEGRIQYKDMEKLIHGFNNKELVDFFFKIAIGFHGITINIEDIVDTWVKLNDVLMARAELKIKGLIKQ